MRILLIILIMFLSLAMHAQHEPYIVGTWSVEPNVIFKDKNKELNTIYFSSNLLETSISWIKNSKRKKSKYNSLSLAYNFDDRDSSAMPRLFVASTCDQHTGFIAYVDMVSNVHMRIIIDRSRTPANIFPKHDTIRLERIAGPAIWMD